MELRFIDFNRSIHTSTSVGHVLTNWSLIVIYGLYKYEYLYGSDTRIIAFPLVHTRTCTCTVSLCARISAFSVSKDASVAMVNSSEHVWPSLIKSDHVCPKQPDFSQTSQRWNTTSVEGDLSENISGSCIRHVVSRYLPGLQYLQRRAFTRSRIFTWSRIFTGSFRASGICLSCRPGGEVNIAGVCVQRRMRSRGGELKDWRGDKKGVLVMETVGVALRSKNNLPDSINSMTGALLGAIVFVGD